MMILVINKIHSSILLVSVPRLAPYAMQGESGVKCQLIYNVLTVRNSESIMNHILYVNA